MDNRASIRNVLFFWAVLDDIKVELAALKFAFFHGKPNAKLSVQMEKFPMPGIQKQLQIDSG
jgi:hypothetical protein